MVKNFEQDVGQQIVTISRLERHLPLGSGAIDDEGEQPSEPGDERIPSLRQTLQALLEELPILRRKDRLGLGTDAVGRVAMVG